MRALHCGQVTSVTRAAFQPARLVAVLVFECRRF